MTIVQGTPQEVSDSENAKSPNKKGNKNDPISFFEAKKAPQNAENESRDQDGASCDLKPKPQRKLVGVGPRKELYFEDDDRIKENGTQKSVAPSGNMSGKLPGIGTFFQNPIPLTPIKDPPTDSRTSPDSSPSSPPPPPPDYPPPCYSPPSCTPPSLSPSYLPIDLTTRQSPDGDSSGENNFDSDLIQVLLVRSGRVCHHRHYERNGPECIMSLAVCSLLFTYMKRHNALRTIAILE